MDTKNKEELLSFRSEYEQSGLTKAEFAKSKDMEYWKANYALRKAIAYQPKGVKPKVGFKPIVSKQAEVINRRELLIKTSYGLEIIIPL